MPKNLFQTIALIAFLLALVVVTLGAYVRLSDAGLGCPDWPGCYGKIGVPKGKAQVEQANRLYPERKLEATKAWKEMTHRYFAGSLGLLIMALAVLSWRKRRANPTTFRFAAGLVVLVVFQALLGMWTVTEKLNPAIVTSHLLMGFLTLALLAQLYLSKKVQTTEKISNFLKIISFVTLLAVVMQIFLGGWTSSNYAAVVCHDFPACYDNQWLPKQDFSEAFVLWRGSGVDYEGGVLNEAARISIHMSHRLGALIAGICTIIFGAFLWFKMRSPFLRMAGLATLLLVVVQISLGISVVFMSRPLHLAVMHNGVAALLFSLLLVIYLQLRNKH